MRVLHLRAMIWWSAAVHLLNAFRFCLCAIPFLYPLLIPFTRFLFCFTKAIYEFFGSFCQPSIYHADLQIL